MNIRLLLILVPVLLLFFSCTEHDACIFNCETSFDSCEENCSGEASCLFECNKRMENCSDFCDSQYGVEY